MKVVSKKGVSINATKTKYNEMGYYTINEYRCYQHKHNEMGYCTMKKTTGATRCYIYMYLSHAYTCTMSCYKSLFYSEAALGSGKNSGGYSNITCDNKVVCILAPLALFGQTGYKLLKK